MEDQDHSDEHFCAVRATIGHLIAKGDFEEIVQKNSLLKLIESRRDDEKPVERNAALNIWMMMHGQDRMTQLLFKRMELQKVIDNDGVRAVNDTGYVMDVLSSRAVQEMALVNREIEESKRGE